MNFTKTDLEQHKQDSELISSKTEIENILNFHKDTLGVTEKMFDAIEEKLKRTAWIEALIVGFIPVFTLKRLSNYDKAKLETERLELKLKLQTQKNHFENAMLRKSQHDSTSERIMNECELEFDNVFTKVKDLIKRFPKSEMAVRVGMYNNPNNDKQVRMEFYLYLKRCLIDNAVKQN